MPKEECPRCHRPNDDNWPITVNDKVEWGGCQECWETESSRMYWDFVQDLGELVKVTKKTLPS